LIKKYNLDVSNPELAKLKTLNEIANELAEQNRLTRIELKSKFLSNAMRILYKTATTEDGKTIVIPPDEKTKKEYDEEIEAIEKEFSDNAI